MSEYMIKKIQNISIVLSSIVIIIFAFYGLGARKQIKVELTQEEINWLNDNQDKLTLWYNAEFPPIEFASEKGVFIGMGADVIKRVEEITEITFTKKPSLDWNDHLNALKSGECAVAPTIVRTQDREDYIIFTQPYATVPVVLITTTGNEANLSLKDFNGKRIGVVSGYATEKYLRDQALVYNYDVVSFFNVQEAINSVSFGQIDAFAENLAVAAYFIEKEGIPNLKVAGKTDYFFHFQLESARNTLFYTMSYRRH